MIFFRYMICYGRLVHFCCPALSVWSCERSAANRFYLFSVFLLSLPIVSASLSNICTVAVVAWNLVHTFSSLLYCALIDDLIFGFTLVWTLSCWLVTVVEVEMYCQAIDGLITRAVLSCSLGVFIVDDLRPSYASAVGQRPCWPTQPRSCTRWTLTGRRRARW